jgi:hypothetical protein
MEGRMVVRWPAWLICPVLSDDCTTVVESEMMPPCMRQIAHHRGDEGVDKAYCCEG